jgi:hypothetical protein
MLGTRILSTASESQRLLLGPAARWPRIRQPVDRADGDGGHAILHNPQFARPLPETPVNRRIAPPRATC